MKTLINRDLKELLMLASERHNNGVNKIERKSPISLNQDLSLKKKRKRGLLKLRIF